VKKGKQKKGKEKGSKKREKRKEKQEEIPFSHILVLPFMQKPPRIKI
jgi:hypothetical protein